MTMPFRDVLQIAFRAGVSPGTVRAYFAGGRRQHPKTVHAITEALAEIGLEVMDARERAAATPVCPHEPAGEGDQ